MASARNEVFLSKVLTRLYPHTADLQSVQSKNQAQPTVTEEPTEAIQPPVLEPADNETSDLCQVKVYTASLPPDDYIVPPQGDVKPSTTEDSDLKEDQPVIIRKRRRRKKKVKLINESTPDGGQNIQQTPQTSEGVKINKNKKRKLQRKRQKERLKAAGLWTEGRTSPSPVCQAQDTKVTQSDIQTEEDQRKIREDLLDFLQATQDVYFSDSTSRSADSALMVEQIREILAQIQSSTVPFSEVQLLNHLRSLLLLQDIERLNNSLDNFKEQSSLSPDHVKALCSLFDYWITNILSIKAKLTE